MDTNNKGLNVELEDVINYPDRIRGKLIRTTGIGRGFVVWQDATTDTLEDYYLGFLQVPGSQAILRLHDTASGAYSIYKACEAYFKASSETNIPLTVTLEITDAKAPTGRIRNITINCRGLTYIHRLPYTP